MVAFFAGLAAGFFAAAGFLAFGVHLKLSLRAGVKNKSLKQSKGTGASGSFQIGEAVKPKKKLAANPKKAKTPKKTAAKKPAAEKKAAKPKAKKPAAANKPAAKPAKKATKSPKKIKAVKPKKTPKKK
jgi:outer membrane biosynthesis protein TonB